MEIKNKHKEEKDKIKNFWEGKYKQYEEARQKKLEKE